MPPDNETSRTLGEHSAALEAHRREMDGLWKKITELTAIIDELKEKLVKVRIQVAIIVAAGIFLAAIVQSVTTSRTLDALDRVYQRKETK
jgi:hypothetical protein